MQPAPSAVHDQEAAAEPPAQSPVRPPAELVLTPAPPAERPREPRPTLRAASAIDDYSDPELLAIGRWVLSDGQLRTDAELIEAMFDELPFRRKGKRIQARLQAIARALAH